MIQDRYKCNPARNYHNGKGDGIHYYAGKKHGYHYDGQYSINRFSPENEINSKGDWQYQQRNKQLL